MPEYETPTTPRLTTTTTTTSFNDRPVSPSTAPPPSTTTTTTTTSSGTRGSDQAAAESFYNKLNRDKNTRDRSLLFHLRNLNNWVKSTIITTESKPANPYEGNTIDVLDLGCGKGGDFFKWKEAARNHPIGRYVGVDIAQSSLDDAIGRYSSNTALQRALGGMVTLACGDIGEVDLVHMEVPVWHAYEGHKGWQHKPLFEPEEEFDGE